jgi:hypothetical protein
MNYDIRPYANGFYVTRDGVTHQTRYRSREAALAAMAKIRKGLLQFKPFQIYNSDL